MNRKEADEIAKKIAIYVNVKFVEIYPDAFVHCTTDDASIYKEANPCMYTWYLRGLRGIQNLDFSPKYEQTDEETVESDWSCVNRFFMDMKMCDDFLKFLIENVRLGY